MKKRKNYFGMTAFVDGSFRLLEDEARCYKLARTVGYFIAVQQVFLPAPFMQPEQSRDSQEQRTIIKNYKPNKSDENLRRAA